MSPKIKTGMAGYNIMVVTASPLTASGLRHLLEDGPDGAAIVVAHNFTAMQLLLKEKRYRFMVIELKLIGGNGIVHIFRALLKQSCPLVKVLVIYEEIGNEQARELYKSGVMGIIKTDGSVGDFRDAIIQVQDNKLYVPGSLLKGLVLGGKGRISHGPKPKRLS
jgi:DNA-binding NarL/FixJ family response regulator